MDSLPSDRELLAVASWLAGSAALRQQLRKRLLPTSEPHPGAFFVEVFLEWEGSSC